MLYAASRSWSIRRRSGTIWFQLANVWLTSSNLLIPNRWNLDAK